MISSRAWNELRVPRRRLIPDVEDNLQEHCEGFANIGKRLRDQEVALYDGFVTNAERLGSDLSPKERQLSMQLREMFFGHGRSMNELGQTHQTLDLQ